MEFKRIREVMADVSETTKPDENIEVPEPKKRGRKAGTTTTKKQAGTEAVANALVSVHALFAGLTKIPEFELSDPEGKMLADSMAELAAAYDFTPSPQTQALIGFGTVVMGVYGLRIYAYKSRISEEKAEQAKREETKTAKEENPHTNILYIQPETSQTLG